MRLLVWPLAFSLALAGGDGPSSASWTAVRQAPSAGPHVLVRIADVEDVDVCGTSCPGFDGERVVRLAPDGTFERISGPALRYGPGAHPWGVHVGSSAVLVRWRSGESMDVPLRHFGRAPRLIWSASGRRFAVLETSGDTTVDRLLVVDPEQRRWLLLPRTRRAVEVLSAAFLSDDRLIAQTFDSHDYVRLTRFDTVTGRVVSSRYSRLGVVLVNMEWSPAAQRLAVEDAHGHVGVVSLADPDRVRRLKLTGAPSWSPDATRILAVPTDSAGETGEIGLAAWPGGTRIRLPQLFAAEWLPDGASLIGLEGEIDLYNPGAVPRVVEVGPDGRVARVIPATWPGSGGGYFPTLIPVAIEGIDPD
jgi:hypothetical protein